MRREYARKKITSIKELREFVTDCLITHSEQRARALFGKNTFAYFYEQGWCDALRTIKDLLSKDGLLLYRYVFEDGENEEEREDASYQ